VSREIKHGAHRIVHQSEDLIINQFGHDPSEADIIALIQSTLELAAGRRFYFIVDQSKVQTLSPPVRRAIGKSAAQNTYKAIGIIGASFQLKVVSKLINSAISIFRREAIPLEFFDSLEKALAWVDDLRAREHAGAA
jgi:hypothetical protein